MAALSPADERDVIVGRILNAVRALVAGLRTEINQMPGDRASAPRPDPSEPSSGPSAGRNRQSTLSDVSRATARFSALADLMFEVERACDGRSAKMKEVRDAAFIAQTQAQAIMALRSKGEAEARWAGMQVTLSQVLAALQMWARKERDIEKRALILRSQRNALVDHTKAGVALVRDLAELSSAPLTDERVYAERGQALVRHVQWLIAIAHQLGARALESTLREGMLSFFAAAKLAFRTRTPASRAAMESTRDTFLKAFVPLLAALKNPETLEADEAALRPAPETPAQEEKKQRTMRALHVSRRVPAKGSQTSMEPVFVMRAKANIPRVLLLQRAIRAWVRRSKWPRLVRQVQESAAAQPARLRFRAMHEVYTSERAYLFALTTLSGVWLEKAQRANKLWQSGDVEAVWGNVAAIRSLTIDLVADLRRAYNAFPGPNGSVGAVFLKYGPWLRLYQQYISSFNRSLARLTDVVAKRPGYGAYLEECMAECARTGQAGLDLGAYLIMPVQRVPRHELLLRTLLKYTPEDHVEHASLAAALRKVKEVNERTNAVTTDVEAFAQSASLTESGSNISIQMNAEDERPPAVQGLSEVPGSHKAKLVSKVHAAERGAPAREALAMLFKEVLVVARKVDAGLYAVHLQLNIRTGVRVQDSMPDMAPLRHGFEVEDKNGTCVVLYCKSIEDRRQWISALKSLVKSAQFDDLLSLVSFKAS